MNIVLSKPTKEAFNRSVVSINNWANGAATALLNKVEDVDTKQIVQKAQLLKEKTQSMMRSIMLTHVLLTARTISTDSRVKTTRDTIKNTTSASPMRSVLSMPRSTSMRLGTNYREDKDETKQLRNLNIMLRNIYSSIEKYLGDIDLSVLKLLPEKIKAIDEALDIALELVSNLETMETTMQKVTMLGFNVDNAHVEKFREGISDIIFPENGIPNFSKLDETRWSGTFRKWIEANNYDITADDLNYETTFDFTNLAMDTFFGSFNFSGFGAFTLRNKTSYTDAVIEGFLQGTQGDNSIIASFVGWPIASTNTFLGMRYAGWPFYQSCIERKNDFVCKIRTLDSTVTWRYKDIWKNELRTNRYTYNNTHIPNWTDFLPNGRPNFGMTMDTQVV